MLPGAIGRRPYRHPYPVIRDLGPADLEGTRVSFINMPIREQAKPNNAPLGPALLAARLREFRADVHIIDLNAYRVEDEESKRRKLPNGRTLTFTEAEDLLAASLQQWGEQDLIGFSGLITTLRWQEAMAKVVRRLQPHCLLVSGGGLATQFRQHLLSWIPELDGIAHSEGDDVILKMAYDARTLRDHGLVSSAHSGKLKPYLVDLEGGRPRFLYDGGRPPDLDRLPFPAWELMQEDVRGFRILDMYLRNPVWGKAARNSSATPFAMEKSISTVSSRGCPFSCNFCFRGAQGERNYGVRSAQNLVDEMALQLERHGVDFVGVVDDNFMVAPQRILDLLPIMQPLVSSSDLRWGTHGRLDEAADLRPDAGGTPRFNRELRIEAMAKAGCVYLGFGAESASPEVLEAMGKGGFILGNGTVEIQGHHLPRSMVEGIRNARRFGIHANCTWIMGYPGETLRNLQDSVAFIQWQRELYSEGLSPGSTEHAMAVGSVNCDMFVATAYPGTEMFETAVVRRKLSERFGVRFDGAGRPIPDQALRRYVLELGDAGKLLHDSQGRPLNFSAMPDDQFLEAREHLSQGRIHRILEMADS